MGHLRCGKHFLFHKRITDHCSSELLLIDLLFTVEIQRQRQGLFTDHTVFQAKVQAGLFQPLLVLWGGSSLAVTQTDSVSVIQMGLDG